MGEKFDENEIYFLENYPEMSNASKEIIKNIIFALSCQSNPAPNAAVPEQDA